jgi:hypothetical protein
MGGDISVHNDSGNQFTVSMLLYRDTADLGLLITDYISLFTWDSTQGAYMFDSIFYLSIDSNLLNSQRPYFPPGEEMGIYTAPIKLDPGKYRFVFSSCCRNPLILNIATPGSEQVIFYADLETKAGTLTSTASCEDFAVGYFALNRPVAFNILPETFEGDSISWGLAVPIGQYPYTTYVGAPMVPVGGFSSPYSDPSGPFTMNPYSGEIKWTPNAYGDFAQSLQINKYRSGQQVSTFVRDMQFVVVSSGGASPVSFVPQTPVIYDSVGDFNYLIYTPGQALSFKINAYCLGSTVKFKAYSPTLNYSSNPATFFTSIGLYDSTSGIYSWTPPPGFNTNVPVVFRLMAGSFVQDYTLLLLPAPMTYTEVAKVSKQDELFTLYPNPSKGNFSMKLNLKQALHGEVTLFSVLGKPVLRQILELNAGEYTLPFSAELASGTYYMILKDGGNMLQAKTLVIE